jgi:zinc transporter ZupT
MKIINILLPIFGCLIGFLIAYNFKSKDLKLILAFSGAFLISLIVFDILPVIYTKRSFTPGSWIMVGILLQIILEFFSKGVEHAHEQSNTNQNKSFIILGSICLHAFLEGVPINKFETLSWGLFIHKIPVSMVVYFIFNKIKKSIKYNILCLSIFTISTPLGAIISYKFPVFDDMIYPLTALVVGMLLHIGTTILFESSEGHKFNVKKIFSIILAILIATII